MPRSFYDRLVLNLFLMEQFGIDTLSEQRDPNGVIIRPFRVMSRSLESCRDEGLASDGLHHFYHILHRWLEDGQYYANANATLTPAKLLEYENNIVSLTEKMNALRQATEQIQWKYFQWLTLLFVEIYLDRYFEDREGLLQALNAFLARFNQAQLEQQHPEIVFQENAKYTLQDLNKLCLQNATGSGKTLLMVANYYQYRTYEKKYHIDSRDNGLALLITTKESLSQQDRNEFNQDGVNCLPYSKKMGNNTSIYDTVFSLEVTKLADEDSEQCFSVDAFGNNNLLFIDEGHAGLSGQETGSWYMRRSKLSEKGFTFEYSATFKQAVAGTNHEDEYAKTILFDYSYRWFYGDGFGKDYQIFNFPDNGEENADVKELYLTASLLKFFQQAFLYETHKEALKPFQIEKPLWVWVGHSVEGKNNESKTALSDVEQIIRFVIEVISKPKKVQDNFNLLLTSDGTNTGLLDKDRHELFQQAFNPISAEYGDDYARLYRDMCQILFHSAVGGRLVVKRVKGKSGEILLKLNNADTFFGEINVSGASELCESLKHHFASEVLEVDEKSKEEPCFDKIKESGSPINLLIGAKKFIEGWDCWRVSQLGLLHFGRTEGVQLIQLFGRGVRLQGYKKLLKRSNRLLDILPMSRPYALNELEMLGVFGIAADALDSFKQYLLDEGLPGNDCRGIISIDIKGLDDKSMQELESKHLKILALATQDGTRISFKKNGPIPIIDGNVPERIIKNPVLYDCYPKILASTSKDNEDKSTEKSRGYIEAFADLLDYNDLYFRVEQWKRRNGKFNLTCTQAGLKDLFKRNNWYILLIPPKNVDLEKFTSYQQLETIQGIARSLLDLYVNKLYNEIHDEYVKPRLKYVDLDRTNPNIPAQGVKYQLIFDDNNSQLKNSMREMVKELTQNGYSLKNHVGGIDWSKHIFQPLLFTQNNDVQIVPFAINTSEFRWVRHLKKYVEQHSEELTRQWGEIYLLRNQSRGVWFGFFEANEFYPDFILWCVKGQKQYITFIDPHGLQMEGGKQNPKVRFCDNNDEKSIKAIQKRLNDPNIILNCFLVTPTPFIRLNWGGDKQELAHRHILFQASLQPA